MNVHMCECVCHLTILRCCFCGVDLTPSGAEKPNPDPPHHRRVRLIGEHPDEP